MRKSKLIATKSHFLLAVKNAEINDEVYSPSFTTSGAEIASNTIAYLVTGNTRNYTSNASHGKVKAFDMASPIGAVRSNRKSSGEVVNFSQLGIVNLNNGNTVSILIFPRDNKPGSVVEHLDSNATTEELNTIDNNQTQTVVISEQCSLTTKIDLNTFEEIEPTVENTVTTEELNIDWG